MEVLLHESTPITININLILKLRKITLSPIYTNPFSHFDVFSRLRLRTGPILRLMNCGGLEADLMMKIGLFPGMNTVL